MADLTLGGQEKKARELVRTGDLEAAGRLCQRILAYYPKYVGAYSVLGQVCLQTGAYERAADLFQRVLGVDPEHAPSYAGLGEIYEKRGQLDEAIWQLERALELAPADDAVRAALYDLYEENDVRHRADMGMTRAALARTYLRGGLYPKAIEELEELLAHRAYRVDLQVALAEALWSARRYGEAETVCTEILEELPHCLKANLILGQIRFNTAEDREARAMLQKAQALDPENRMAQAVLESDSPLPPRKVRLPLQEGDASWEPPSYLLEAEEEDAEPLTIEGTARKLPGREEEPPRLEGAPAHHEGETNESQEAAATDRGAVSADPLWLREGLAYVAEHPEDHATRLDLARRLGSMGRLDEAATQYGRLIRRDDKELLCNITEDLVLLNRWYNGHQHLANLLLTAKEYLEDLEAEE